MLLLQNIILLKLFFVNEAELNNFSASEKIVLVSDSSKFGMVNPSYFGDIQDIDTIITDEGIPKEYLKICDSLGVEVIIAGQSE